ncbi:MAG: transporter substrate-binding domain-containing protein [Bilophila sp.]
MEHYGFALRKTDTATIAKLNKAIKAVKDKGIEKQIIAKWLGE